MASRIVLLVASPRLPAGLLTWQAWQLLQSAAVCAGVVNDQVEAVRAAGVPVSVIEPTAEALLAQAEARGVVVWLSGPAGDPVLARELGMRLVRDPGLAELELMYGSWDPPGARLLDTVTVLDRLVGPGGDPWLSRYVDPELATGDDLANYLLEEAYEAYDAMRSGDTDAIREELGDVLLQVVLHARIAAVAASSGAEGFTIDDVAGDLVAKLVRRNPHVFDGAKVRDLDEITRNWEQIKRSEKARTSAMDGMAMSQPALALAAELLSGLRRAALSSEDQSAPAEQRGASAGRGGVGDGGGVGGATQAMTEHDLGTRLFAMVELARASGLNAEAALRAVVLERVDAIRRAELGHTDDPGVEDVSSG